MKERKTDQRSRFTQSMVENALITLLKKSQLKNITVSELCNEAQICRGTFYNQYLDIYDVYESIEQKFFEMISHKLQSQKLYSLELAFFLDIMYFVRQNIDWFSIIFTNLESNSLIKRITDSMKEIYISQYTANFPSLSQSLITKVFTYSTTGSIGILADWIKNNATESPESIAELINNLNTVITKQFLKI